MKTRPVDVIIGPPTPGRPSASKNGNFPPSGTSHTIVPVFMSTAASVPHGGGLHGTPIGDNSSSRFMPNGVPVCAEISLSGSAFSAAATLSAGISVTTCITRFVLTSSHCRCGSHAALPQLTPPPVNGYRIVPSRLGGVNNPSERCDAIALRHAPRSRNVRPHASSAVIFCGTSGGGFCGNGCVGDNHSPLTAPVGTGRSSTGYNGSPVSRSSVNTSPVFVGCSTAATGAANPSG